MTIKQILNPVGALFEQRKRLNETREPATMEELQKLENQAIEYKEKGDFRLYNALHKPMEKTKYKYLFADEGIRQNISLYYAIKSLILEGSTIPSFIKNGDKFIAFIGYNLNENDPKIVSNVKLFNFDMDDPHNDTFKDTLELMNILIENYKEVNFIAMQDNTEIVNIYKKYNKRHNGVEPVVKNGQIYFKIPGKNRG
jgi:hypothetical protein